MKKNVLIISSSPRKNGNSAILAEQFEKGASSRGNRCELIHLAGLDINYCRGCGNCYNLGNPCPQRDDSLEIIVKMINADVIVLATPVYFYAPSAQLMTLIDRCCARYQEMSGKDVYLILTAADEDPRSLDPAVETIRGFIRCLPDAEERGVIYGTGAWQPGDIRKTDAPEKAFAMGESV